MTDDIESDREELLANLLKAMRTRTLTLEEAGQLAVLLHGDALKRLADK